MHDAVEIAKVKLKCQTNIWETLSITTEQRRRQRIQMKRTSMNILNLP